MVLLLETRFECHLNVFSLDLVHDVCHTYRVMNGMHSVTINCEEAKNEYTYPEPMHVAIKIFYQMLLETIMIYHTF